MSLFQDIIYHLSNALPPHRQEQLEYALSKNGATKATSLTSATHVIADSPHFEGVEDYWVDRTLVLGKVQPPQYYSADPSMIFSGVVACACSEIPTHDLEVLSAGISALGGQWRVSLTNDITHLFATNQSSHKYTAAFAHRESTGIKIILPHWFDDSIRLGLPRLPVAPYEWPDPPFLKEIGVKPDGVGVERKEDKGRRNMMRIVNDFTPSIDSKVPLPKDVDLLPVKKGVLEGKRILLSWTLTLYGGRREAVEAGIRRAGGVVLRYPGDDGEDLSTEEKERRRDRKEARAAVECDVLVTRWRRGRAYGKAFRLKKTIGTMAWLFNVESTGIMSRPVDQLLHYPVPRKPIENFSQHVCFLVFYSLLCSYLHQEITVTNYTGESREYLKRIITAMGAKFTPMMTGNNTVLIAAYIHGQKTSKARAWSIPVVNHTWLEDCFIQWRNLTTSTEKYIVFPQGMDFSRLLGERGMGVRGVELCDEEELKEEGSGSGSDGSDDEERKAEGGGEEDESVKVGVGEDIDMISMPDTNDDYRRDPTPKPKSPTKTRMPKSNRGVSGSVSPSKQARGSMSVSPNKRVAVSPPKAQETSKSVSPTKKRKIVFDDEDGGVEMDINKPTVDVEESEEEERPRKKSQPQPTAVQSRSLPNAESGDDEDPVQPVTPSKKSKMKAKDKTLVSSARKRRDISVDLELSESDKQGKEREKAMKKEKEKEKPKPSGLLKMTRGDARTRIKPRTASTATKEKSKFVYSDSEDEVLGIVKSKTQESLQDKKAKGKGKTKGRKGRKSKQVSSSSSEEDDEEVEFESEETDSEIERKKKTRKNVVEKVTPKMSSNANATPLSKKISVVVELPPTGSQTKKLSSAAASAKPTPKTTYGSKGKKKVVEYGTEDEGDESEGGGEGKKRRVRKDESVRVEAGDKAATPSISLRKPSKLVSAKTKANATLTAKALPPASSLLSTINNAPSTSTNTDEEIFSAPVVILSAKRGAAAKAEMKLKEMMPDATKYEMEVKKARKSGGWSSLWEKEERVNAKAVKEEGRKKRASEVNENEIEGGDREPSRKKRRKDVEEEEESGGEDEVVSAAKRGRPKRVSDQGVTSTGTVYLMTTQVSVPAEAIKSLEKLGVVMTTKPSQCTHLLAPSIVRTEKFLCALANAPVILQASWAMKSAHRKQLLPVDGFMLKDPDAETKYKVKLGEALGRAKQLKGTLFAGETFYVTAKTKVDRKLLKIVVTAHGGQLVLQQPTFRLINGHEDRHVISCPGDISIWRPLAAQGIPIYTHEFLLIGVMKQEVEWDGLEFRVPGSVNVS
ncbi:BRCT-containing protein 1 [Leucoagaricus sp. SymC.cos]|nr:BRCT-containing protein 1 [Leucoagaricus sp. SymC.cos]